MKLIRINLQQAIVLSENNTILAASSEHNNKVVVNKPLILDMGVQQVILSMFIEAGCLQVNPTVIYTDSYSIGYWDANTDTTKLL